MSDSRVTTLGELLNHVLRVGSTELRVSMPGRVESYDESRQCANVQPLLKERVEDIDGTVKIESLPVINRVPVIFPGAGGYQLRFPVKAGDIVLLVFGDRSVDKWKSQGGEVDPVDLRQHNISDAVCIPGLHSFTGNPAQAIDVTSTGEVHVGGALATQAAMMGTAYRAGDATFDLAVSAAGAAVATAIGGTLTSQIALVSDTNAKTALTTLSGIVGTFAAALVTAATAKEAGSATYLSTIVKVK